MNITIVIPDAIAQRVIDAIATRFGYQATIGALPNPQTKAQFVKNIVCRWIKDQVKEHEAATAGATANQDAAQKAEAEIVIT
jgi:hypothetical protein